jgi:four helix bundle protein
VENDLRERLFTFAVEVLKMLRGLGNGKEIEVIKYQLSKSSTSAGANYEEAQSSVSRAEFSNKVSISLKEMRESNYWLRLINTLIPEAGNITALIKESEELSKILASILIKTRK